MRQRKGDAALAPDAAAPEPAAKAAAKAQPAEPAPEAPGGLRWMWVFVWDILFFCCKSKAKSNWVSRFLYW